MDIEKLKEKREYILNVMNNSRNKNGYFSNSKLKKNLKCYKELLEHFNHNTLNEIYNNLKNEIYKIEEFTFDKNLTTEDNIKKHKSELIEIFNNSKDRLNKLSIKRVNKNLKNVIPLLKDFYNTNSINIIYEKIKEDNFTPCKNNKNETNKEIKKLDKEYCISIIKNNKEEILSLFDLIKDKMNRFINAKFEKYLKDYKDVLLNLYENIRYKFV